jgi:hypothetical protein
MRLPDFRVCVRTGKEQRRVVERSAVLSTGIIANISTI